MISLKNEYFFTFGEYPPLLMGLSYEDEDYQMLMIKAIEQNRKITDEELQTTFHNKYDLVEEFDSDEDFWEKVNGK